MNMFEFLVFQAGGLVLWPVDAESQNTKRYVDQYIQNDLLGSHETSKGDDKYKVFCDHDTEHDLYFTVSVKKGISQQITYMPKLLGAVRDRFVAQFGQILGRKDSMLLEPVLFTAFDVNPVIDQFRGKTGREQEPPTPQQGDLKRSKSLEMKQDKQQARSKSAGRVRYTDKKVDPAMQSASEVVGGGSKRQQEQIEEYDLDDFKGVFKPTQKPATGLTGLFKAIVGEKVLTEEAVMPVLSAFEQHLINKNVAAHIARDLTEAVGKKLIGTKCTNFSNVKTIVTASLKEAIERILTPDRNLDLIRDIQSAKEKGEPYVMAFVGVNGVGKSTSLAKVAYLFKSHNFKVLIAACDTYRSGAVEQLGVHSQRLDIDLYQKGGNRRDPVPVAKQAKEYAKENGYDVLLIDTAGRMQNDLNLMRQIARLINESKPDLTVFVAEALVGNNGSDQIQSFDKTLREHKGGQNTKGIDGIILTKFDTIDDKVGASLTLVFETGHPIVFLGVGQNYRDLRRMNPEFVVATLLDGF